MTDEEKIESAKRAVKHVLKRIRDDERVRYHFCAVTESYVLLTEAASALFDEPIEKVREIYPG